MSDVLFDTGKCSLRPLAREKLAKVAGIVSGHPGLQLDIEGHTDSHPVAWLAHSTGELMTAEPQAT